MRRSLVQVCAQLSRDAPRTSEQDQEPSSVQQVIAQWQARVALADSDPTQLRPHELLSLPRTMRAVAPVWLTDPADTASDREGLRVLADLTQYAARSGALQADDPILDVPWLHATLQQALAFAPGAADASFLSAAMQLALALAELTYGLPSAALAAPNTHGPAQPAPPQHTTPADNPSPPTPVVAPVTAGSPGPPSADKDVNPVAKRRRTVAEEEKNRASQQEPLPPQQGSHAAVDMGQPLAETVQDGDGVRTSERGGGGDSEEEGELEPEQYGRAPPMDAARAAALHRGLIAWTAHWCPRVRRGALAALLAAHGGCSSSPDDALCDPCQVESAYNVSVVCVGDDEPSVRVVALRLAATLAHQHTDMRLPGDRWIQLGVAQRCVDDAAQRLAGCTSDGETYVRRHAMQLLAGILGACNLRVKLQLLSKKATVLATPNTHDTQTTTHTDRSPHTTTNKGTKRGGGGRGAAAQAAPSAPVASAWCGALGSRGLSLLDVSVGALVRGVEDEDWRVRGAAASALVAASACELLTLRNGDAVPPNDGAGAEDTGKGTSGMTEGTGGSSGGGGGGGGGVNGGDMASRRQVVAQCVECLCDLTQDETAAVRVSALQGLDTLITLACDTPHTTTHQQHTTPTPTTRPSLQATQDTPAPLQGTQSVPEGTEAGASSKDAAPIGSGPSVLTGTEIGHHNGSGVLSGPLPDLYLIRREQLLELLTALYDPDAAVRAAARRLVARRGACEAWSNQLVRALADAAAKALTAPHTAAAAERGEVLAVVRGVAARAPAQAKAVATQIAKQHTQTSTQQQPQQQRAGQSAAAQPVASAVTKQHLLVMQALVQR